MSKLKLSPDTAALNPGLDLKAARLAAGAPAATEDKAALFLHWWGVVAGLEREYRGDVPAEPVAEYKFDPKRHWRFDYAWPDKLVAVEVDGGRWAPGGGRHGGDRDREKTNSAASQGWRVLHFSPKQLEDDPRACVCVVMAAMKWTPQ